MTGFLGFRLHLAEPKFPTKVRAYTGTLLTKDMSEKSPAEGLNNYTDHAVARWYGVSFKLKWFAGVWLFGPTSHPTERGPIPS